MMVLQDTLVVVQDGLTGLRVDHKVVVHTGMVKIMNGGADVQNETVHGRKLVADVGILHQIVRCLQHVCSVHSIVI